MISHRLASRSNQIVLSRFAVQIRTADTDYERTRATALINEMYAWRGYGSHHDLVPRPGQLSLVAYDRISGSTVGTLTVRLDGNDGLFAEKLYSAEVQSLRAKGYRLCEMTKFAVGRCASPKHLLGRLFHVAFVHAYHLHGRSDLLIEVTPRHARFYQHMLHFERLGAEKINPRVNTRGVLLRLRLDYAAAQIDRHGGQGETSRDRSLYPYALSPNEQEAIFDGIGGSERSLAAAA